MAITLEKVERIAEKLREMPEVDNKKRDVSKQEAVKILTKEIYDLRKRGYTLEQISETLKGEGLSIATPTLKNYLQRTKPLGKSKIAKASVTKTDTPPPAPALVKADKTEIKSDKNKATFKAREDSIDI